MIMIIYIIAYSHYIKFSLKKIVDPKILFCNMICTTTNVFAHGCDSSP